MAMNIVVPEMGESIVEATISAWLKQEGERVAVGEPVVELETEKANMQIVSEWAGILAHIEHGEGEDVKIGDTLGTVEGAPQTEAAVKQKLNVQLEPAQPTSTEQSDASAVEAEMIQTKGKVTPVAQRLAQELGVDVERVLPSGPGGRVTKQDMQAFKEKRDIQAATPPPAPQAATPTPSRTLPPAAPTTAPELTSSRKEERVRMSRRRQTIARRLIEATQTTAMLTTFNEVDMTAVMELRKRRRESFKERHGVSLGIMSFFVKAVIGALKFSPRLNAEIQGDEILFKHYYDIGIAVGAEDGLVVPVLRDADRMSFAGIELAIKEFVQKAETNTLTLEDLRGGTFTISNGGVYGSLLSTPILNPPQVGILGLHKIEERPIAIDGAVAIHPMMYVALSYDHRIVDGREAVQFLGRVKELIEDPEKLLLEG